MKLIKTCHVSASVSDSTVNLSTLGVFQFMQDAITELMGKLKIDGVTARKLYNAVWLFVKTKVRFFKHIPWGDDAFTVTSFISAVAHATICIDVAIKNHADELCAYSRTEICAIDLQTGRIRRVESVGVTPDVEVEQALTDVVFGKFDSVDMTEIDKVKVRSTNIDMSQHTNNVEYVRFILNTYSVEEMQCRTVREMEIKYVNQSYENDVLTVHKASCGDKDTFLIDKDGRDIVKCAVVF